MENNNIFNIILQKYNNCENIAIMGPAGTGKTTIIKKIITDYHKTFGNNKNNGLAVCGMTGCAAILLNCGATTLHSWAKVGLANNSWDKILHNIKRSPYKLKNWLNTKLLIIDEISMMSLELLRLLDFLGKNTRINKKPIGGIQVIFTGDFLQLPPVFKRGNSVKNDIERNDIERNDIERNDYCKMFFKNHNLWFSIFPVYNNILL